MKDQATIRMAARYRAINARMEATQLRAKSLVIGHEMIQAGVEQEHIDFLTSQILVESTNLMNLADEMEGV